MESEAMSETRVLAVAWVPLEQAALCVSCETVFNVQDQTCPACGHDTFALLARWLCEHRAAR